MKSPLSVTTLFLLFFVVFFSQCGHNQKELLCSRWKTVKIINKSQQEALEFMKYLRDSVNHQQPGLASAEDMTNLAMNMSEEISQVEEQTRLAYDKTIMEFKPNGRTYTYSEYGNDSAMYELRKDGVLITDEAKLKGFGKRDEFHILELTQDTLKLLHIADGDSTTAVMIHAQ